MTSTPNGNIEKIQIGSIKVLLEKNYAGHLGIDDDDYVSSGAEISEDKKKILTNFKPLQTPGCLCQFFLLLSFQIQTNLV